MGSIPASKFVQINPDVVGTGGNPLSLNGVIVSQNAAVPVGTVLSFSSADSVADYFGSASTQASMASIYFKGFDGATKLPSTLYFSAFAEADTDAFIFGGSMASISLDTLKTYTGTLTIVVAGVSKTSSSIDLSAATSYTNAATIITAAFTTPGFAVVYDSQRTRFVVQSTSSGATETIVFATGTIAASLKLTQATGAILAQGTDAETEADALNRLKAATQNWASFTTDYEPDSVSKLAFAAWANGTNQRFEYLCYDSDANTVVANATTTVGAQAKALAYDGSCFISGQPSVASANSTTVEVMARNVVCFVMGAIASVDFAVENGRITFAFKHQAGLAANVDDDQIADNLIGNGYNFYGAYGTANDQFVFFNNGNVPGRWVWLDEYINQIFLNSQFQLAFMTLLTSVNSIPYNQDGDTQIREAAADPINQGRLSGIIRRGVPLSAAQASQVNAQAGTRISDTLSSAGYYLQITAPSAQDRGLRKSPGMKFWYTSGGAIQQIVMSSIDVL